MALYALGRACIDPGMVPVPEVQEEIFSRTCFLRGLWKKWKQHFLRAPERLISIAFALACFSYRFQKVSLTKEFECISFYEFKAHYACIDISIFVVCVV